MSANQGTGENDDFEAASESGFYQRHYSAVQSSGTPSAAETPDGYPEALPAYGFGHLAAMKPSHRGRTYEEVELDLRREFGDESRFEKVRDFVREGFEWKTMLAGLAGGAGAWWAGREVYDALREMNEEDERDVHTAFQSHPAKSAGLAYSRARSGYALGYAAARNPDYNSRSFEEIEPHLQTAYTGSGTVESQAVRDFARRGYERGSSRKPSDSAGS